MKHDAISVMSSLPPVIERHELKYVIPFKLVDVICDYLTPLFGYDEHSLAYADRYYPINSLYFDTPNYRFLKLRMWGAAHRFNMRVRAYGDGTKGPYFAEVKYKSPHSVKKFRATLEPDQWPGFIAATTAFEPIRHEDDKETISRDLFQRLAYSYAIEPKIFTCYRRRALCSTVDDYARVTFDIDMRYRDQSLHSARDPFSLACGADCANYDVQTIYGEEISYGENVIMELKANVGAVPTWMLDLISRFQLKQIGFSKYMSSSQIEHEDNGWHYMSGDRSDVRAL